MLPFQFDRLLPGTLIHRKSESPNDFYVVTAHYGNRLTAVRAVDITNPAEWEIVRIRGVLENTDMPPKLLVPNHE